MADTVPVDRPVRALWVRLLVVGAVSVLLGVLTFFAQGVLPDAWRSFANSASGWTLLTAVLVFASRAATRLAAVLGAVSFVLLVVGYSMGAAQHGLSYSPVLFGVVGLVVGPFVGVAAVWLRDRAIRGGLGVALLTGIFVGEAVYGLTVIADSTRPEYWVLIGSVGVVLLIGMVFGRLRGWTSRLVAVAGATVTAGAFVVAYSMLGGV
ncbi:MAG: DUF6518 family protein [Propionicimonas sp.]|uniref:DUF6518 family protein n=1 Tax=Propionicimonas sp. TaxID=1955623 RepID=UPI003D0BFED1